MLLDCRFIEDELCCHQVINRSIKADGSSIEEGRLPDTTTCAVCLSASNVVALRKLNENLKEIESVLGEMKNSVNSIM